MYKDMRAPVLVLVLILMNGKAKKKIEGIQANRKSHVRDCVSIDKINWIMIIALG